MPEQPWEEFVKEFNDMVAGSDYKPFRPLLTKTEALIGRNRPEDQKTARALVNYVKFLRTQKDAGEDVTELLDEKTARGFVQAEWEVEGDVKQANKDFFDNSIKYVLNIVLGSAKELDLAASSPKIQVPIVPVVMTDVQAQELISLTVFKEELKILENGFVELNDYLKAEAADWIQRYGTRPQDWKPFGSGPNDLTLEQLIGNAMKGLSAVFNDVDFPLVASFKDVIALAEGEAREKLRGLREKGCIVILDVISLRHPKLQRAFQQTLLDAYPRTAVVSMAPNEGCHDKASQLAVAMLKVSEMEFQRRIDDIGDYGTCELVVNERRFKAWLSTRLKDFDPSKKLGAPRVL